MNNASSFYYNPSLLTFNFPKFSITTTTFKKIDLYLSYIKYFQDINYISFFSVMDIKKVKRLGIGFLSLFFGDITSNSTDGVSYSTGEKMNICFYSFLIGYGYNLTDKIGIGINLKFPIEKLGDETCIGLGTDIGGIYKQNNWGISILAQNIGYEIKKIKKTYGLPMRVKIGGNYSFYLLKKKYSKSHKMTITTDVGKEIETDFILSIGMQYSFREIIFLRSGCRINNKKKVDIRMGCGFSYRNYYVDYGYSGREIGKVHRVGIGVRFDFAPSSQIVIEEREKEIVIKISENNAILFEYNKAKLRKDAYKALDKVVDILKRARYTRVLICGHTDNIGSEEFNLNLSKMRAKAVYNYFVKKGIEKSIMSIKGYGSSKPIASNKTEQGRAKNRRVEIILLKLSKEEKDKFEYHYYMGLDHYYRGGYEYAIEEFEKALKIDPHNENVKEWLMKAKNEVKMKMKRRKK